MNKRFGIFILALATGASLNTIAQSSAAPKSKVVPDDRKEESIIIRKNEKSKEKITITIDGDKITVNGKPVDEFTSRNIDIVHFKQDRADAMAYAPYPPKPPIAPYGSKKAMVLTSDNFMVHTNRAFLGVMTEKNDKGAVITEVTDESAAAKAGLKSGDIITKIDTSSITDASSLYKVIAKYKPNDTVSVNYIRDGKTAKTSAVLKSNTQVKVYNWSNDDYKVHGDFDFDNFSIDSKPRLGAQVQDTEDDKGVKVLDVNDDSPADKAGLKNDDIITAVNGKSITSVTDIKNLLTDVKKGDTIKLSILRNNSAQTIDVKFPKDLKTSDL
jgi:serine protease Do